MALSGIRFREGLYLLLLFLLPDLVQAQLCSGNLGDPIVNITFGGDFTPSRPPRGIEFKPGGGCPKPGFFSMASLLFGCGDANSWYLLAGDHTHDQGGKYMVVNAENLSGTLYHDTITGLCGSTPYQFSAFITNDLKAVACGGNPQMPKFTLSAHDLGGTLLGTTSAVNTQQGARIWNAYGFFFTTPAVPGPVILDITVESPKGCGSVFSMDDITLRPCGPTLSATLEGLGTNVISICSGDTQQLVLSGTYSPGMTDPVTVWQKSRDTGATWTDIPGAHGTRYPIPSIGLPGVTEYRLSIAERANAASAKCRTVSNFVWVDMHPQPARQPLQNLIGCLDKDITMRVNTFAASYHWEGPNGFVHDLPGPLTLKAVQYSDSGLYTCTLVSDLGCKVKDSFQLGVFPATTIQAAPHYAACEGDLVRLSATGGQSFIWTPSTGLSSPSVPNPVLTASDSIVYQVLTINSYGCRDSAFVTVDVFRNPTANAGHDLYIISGDTVMLKGSASGTDISHVWTPDLHMSDAGSLTPSVYPPSQTEYTLNVSSPHGCPGAEDRMTVNVYNDLFIPNAFTPNGDGINDVFHVITLDGYTLLRLSIYNRFGQLVYQSSDPYAGWDGNIRLYPQAAGNYVYYVEWKLDNGQLRRKKGNLMLIR
jgi:gliding motility-associated-like protein